MAGEQTRSSGTREGSSGVGAQPRGCQGFPAENVLESGLAECVLVGGDGGRAAAAVRPERASGGRVCSGVRALMGLAGAEAAGAGVGAVPSQRGSGWGGEGLSEFGDAGATAGGP